MDTLEAHNADRSTVSPHFRLDSHCRKARVSLFHMTRLVVSNASTYYLASTSLTDLLPTLTSPHLIVTNSIRLALVYERP